MPKPASLGAYLRQVSGLPYWRERILTTCRHALGRVADPFVAPHARPRIVREARLLLGVYAALALGSALAATDALLVFWLLIWFFFARGLPSADALLAYQPPLPTNVRDYDGEPIADFARERKR